MGASFSGVYIRAVRTRVHSYLARHGPTCSTSRTREISLVVWKWCPSWQDLWCPPHEAAGKQRELCGPRLGTTWFREHNMSWTRPTKPQPAQLFRKPPCLEKELQRARARNTGATPVIWNSYYCPYPFTLSLTKLSR